MMDSDNVIVEGNEAAHRNGLDEHLIVLEEDNFLPDSVNGNVETGVELENGGISTGEMKEGSNECDSTVSKEGEVIAIQKFRKMSVEERRKLGTTLTRLALEDLSKALKTAAQDNPSLQALAEEVDLDVDAQAMIT